MSKSRLALLIVIGLLIGFYIIGSQSNDPYGSEPKSIMNLNESEYFKVAVENCSKTESESDCRCIYRSLLDKYGLDETRRLDLEVTANPEYEFSESDIQLAAKCMLNTYQTKVD